MTIIEQSLPLPRWAHVPGVDEGADHAPLMAAKTLVPARFAHGVPAAHPALRYGLRLNDEGFFWEAHEILEAVWKAAPQGGRDRLCLRGCIQVANANLKLKMGRARAAERLITDAITDFTELGRRRPSPDREGFAGIFPAPAVLARLAGRDHAAGPGPVRLGDQA